MVKSVGPLYDQLEKIEGLHLTSDYDCDLKQIVTQKMDPKCFIRMHFQPLLNETII